MVSALKNHIHWQFSWQKVAATLFAGAVAVCKAKYPTETAMALPYLIPTVSLYLGKEFFLPTGAIVAEKGK